MSGPAIGVFDSGVGGLSILREIQKQHPNEPLCYFADQAHVPYGPRSLEQVRQFSLGITRFLLDQPCKLLVVACNTASAAALHHLRRSFPSTPFVGMEPAVKPAAELSQSRRVAVLATPATFQGELFASVIERFAQGVEVIQIILPGLVERIEAGDLGGVETRAILEAGLRPITGQGVDTLVLACTHYAFVIPLLEELVGPSVRVIDPAPAIARQTGRLLTTYKLAAASEASGSARFVTSGDPLAFRSAVAKLLRNSPSVERARWDDSVLVGGDGE